LQQLRLQLSLLCRVIYYAEGQLEIFIDFANADCCKGRAKVKSYQTGGAALKTGALANYLLGEYSLGVVYMPARSESERLEYIDVDDGERN
jgi:hypothetical protein